MSIEPQVDARNQVTDRAVELLDQIEGEQ